MAKKKEKQVEKIEAKKVAPKKTKKKENIEEASSFESRSDIKKLVLYTVIVPRGQGENVVHILKANKSSAQFVRFGEGTASNAIREILGTEDTKKDIVYSIVREDAVNEIKKELDVYFIASKKNRGIAYTISLTGIVGVKLYKFFTQTVRG